ncbi:hypothetical protein RIF29_41417 [Crotalaria pallida]|uniref:Uncharacterized protein n=1 Tax=Crotalaria pallida TaxID=3830 RepID=A0AAN9E803_CROPI
MCLIAWITKKMKAVGRKDPATSQTSNNSIAFHSHTATALFAVTVLSIASIVCSLHCALHTVFNRVLSSLRSPYCVQRRRHLSLCPTSNTLLGLHYKLCSIVAATLRLVEHQVFDKLCKRETERRTSGASLLRI